MVAPEGRDFVNLRCRLEREFCDPARRHLRDRIRTRRTRRHDRETLVKLFGVRDRRFVDRLCHEESDAESVAALVLVPLVLVAWADRHLSARERGVILDAAEEFGIERGSPAFNLLGQWLRYKPTRELREAWIDYVKALCNELGSADREWLADRILSRARSLIDGGRGLPGLDSLAAWRRARALDHLESAFER